MASDYFNIPGLDSAHARQLAHRYGLKKLAVFGSFSRGEQNADSDIDLLVEWMEGSESFRSFMGLIEEMQQLTGRKVDITTPSSLHWYLKDRILSEAKDLI
jgi:predicted nucleotidyltransferase